MEKITAQELRIGNLVAINGVITKVTSISNEGINQCLDTLGHCPVMEYEKWQWIEPLEITEEWLLEKGLIEDTAIYGTPPPLPYPYSVIYSHEFGAALVEYTEYSKEVRYIKYVHQLQNLYFALTGTELTIKPQP